MGLEAVTKERDAAQADFDGLLAAGAEHAHPADLVTLAEFDHLERRRVVAQFVREVRVARGRGRYVKAPMEERVEILWRDAPDDDLVQRAAAAALGDPT